MDCMFVWVMWNGRLQPEIRRADYIAPLGSSEPVARFPLTESAAKLPLAELAKLFPPPVLTVVDDAE